MSISFNQIPTDRLTPFTYIEFDSSRAVQGPGARTLKTMLIAQRLASGTVAQLVPKLISSVSQAESFFGVGSQLADMVRAFKQNNNTGELWACALNDGAGAKASGSFAFSGTATEAGTVYAYIGGYRVKVAVEDGDTASDVATALQTELALTENNFIPALTSKTSGTLSMVARNAGLVGNDMNLRLNYYEGEQLPAGIACTVTQPVSGTGEPDLQDVIDVLGSEQYDVFVHPYTDSANLTAIEGELEDRWGPLTQNDGVSITYKQDIYANLVTLGMSRNSPHSVVMGGYGSPTAPWRIAAALAANVAYYGQIDPGRPFQTLQLQGVLAPAIVDRFDASERNILLQKGIATFLTDAGSLVRIERTVTTYKTNPYGAPDTSYRDLNTVMTLSYLRWDFRNYVQNKYPRHKLAADGTRYKPGQAIMTPKLMKSEAVLKFTEWESIGLVEGFAQFKNDLVVERNISDPNRLDVLLPIDLINQLVIVGAQIQFLL